MPSSVSSFFAGVAQKRPRQTEIKDRLNHVRELQTQEAGKKASIPDRRLEERSKPVNDFLKGLAEAARPDGNGVLFAAGTKKGYVEVARRLTYTAGFLYGAGESDINFYPDADYLPFVKGLAIAFSGPSETCPDIQELAVVTCMRWDSDIAGWTNERCPEKIYRQTEFDNDQQAIACFERALKEYWARECSFDPGSAPGHEPA